MSIIQAIIREPDIVSLIGQQYEEFIHVNRRYNSLRPDDKYKLEQCSTKFTLGTNTLDGVFWVSGRIAFEKCHSNRDSISFDFSGCWMARLKSGEGDFTFHISTDTYEPRDCKMHFLRYLNEHYESINDISIFQPLSGYDRHCSLINMFLTPKDNESERRVWGVITQTGECYSIIVDAQCYELNENEGYRCFKYSLYAIIKHPKFGKEILQQPEVLNFLNSGASFKERSKVMEGIWTENYKRLQYLYRAK